VLVTLTGPDGKTVTKTIDVKQLARDPLFKAIASNPYPPTAGDYTFTVTSDWSWRVASSSQPWLAVSDFATRSGSPTASHEYTFHLDEYPGSGYSTETRTANIGVESDDLEFPPGTTVPIVQTRGPYLVITDPASKQHAFGSSPTARIVTFRVNAGWTFATDANFDKVIAGATYDGSTIVAGNVKTGSTSPATEVIEKVTFAPVISSLAGFATTGVTFSTTNHSGVPTPSSDVVTFTRLVPAEWTFVGSNPVAGSTIPTAASTEVTIVAHTNLPWWGQQESATKVPSGPLTAYKENDEVKVSVPARPTNVASSWNSSGNITIRAGYDGWPPEIPALAPSHEFTLHQPVYKPVHVTSITPLTVPGKGGTVNVTFTNTDAADFYVEWRDSPTYEGSTALSSQINVMGIGVKAVSCPASYTNRSLYLYHATTGTLLYATPVTQQKVTWVLINVVWDDYNRKATYSCPGGYTYIGSPQGQSIDLSDAVGTFYYDSSPYWTPGGYNYIDDLYYGYIWRINSLGSIHDVEYYESWYYLNYNATGWCKSN
jgi:hypothetical protein